MLLLQIPQYPSSSRLALLGTRRKYSVRNLFGVLAFCWTAVFALELDIRLSGGSGAWIATLPIGSFWTVFVR